MLNIKGKLGKALNPSPQEAEAEIEAGGSL